MKNLLLGLIAVIFTLGFGIPDADAKRLGGGGSFGMQRQMSPSAPRQPSAAPQQTPQGANAVPQKRSWMGPLAGLAAGLGLAALFSHLGLGAEMGSFLMIALLALAALMLFRMLSRRNAAARSGGAMQYAGAPAGGSFPASAPASFPAASSAVAPAPAGNIPANFDAEAFVRQAKVQFIRLQAANDAGNLEDIREFTSPEMFAEIRMQLTERAPGTQRTDVVELNGEVIEVVEEAQRYVVSIRFSGLLREEEGAAPVAFDEVWHLTKPRTGNAGWVVAGIQQLS
ncbi:MULTISPECIES: Tim44 domain-containing protein [Aromatoleum]|uniref:Tim44 domain-containing protein n=2 Tax=Aromatoleum TaxID=551759 RepID=A0ABX1NQ66_9RHOO|nr:MULTISPECIES: Tim44-like domain-containing protein [Aromatoleum]MCK0507575.1 Tim44-like domain-containing protein [Aromatoleum anaerobium]NMG13976.1 Tim44 domain-containing protein [Aromatoleum bremense]QTQ31849.1 Tim44-like domain containing protein [Aromatoleum bremense]